MPNRPLTSLVSTLARAGTTLLNPAGAAATAAANATTSTAPVATPGSQSFSALATRPSTAPAQLAPRRALSTLPPGADVAGGTAALDALALKGVMRDGDAWRTAWRELQQLPAGEWAPALQQLERLEQKTALALRGWEAQDQKSPLSPEQRDHVVALQDLLWGVRDGQALLAAASAGGPVTPMQLARQFGLSADAASHSPVAEGAAPLELPERMALSLYSVNSQVQMLREPVLSRAFHAINAALRHDQPEMQWALQGLTQPLLSGLARLPAVQEPVMRGLWLPGPDALAAVADRMQPGATIDTKEILTGSREAPYPGQVVFTMTPLAQGTKARDTSAFSYAEEQREAAFAPGARFAVASAEVFEPGRKGEAKLDLSDALTASSGRSWQALRDQPLLKVALQELPPADRS